MRNDPRHTRSRCTRPGSSGTWSRHHRSEPGHLTATGTASTRQTAGPRRSSWRDCLDAPDTRKHPVGHASTQRQSLDRRPSREHVVPHDRLGSAENRKGRTALCPNREPHLRSASRDQDHSGPRLCWLWQYVCSDGLQQAATTRPVFLFRCLPVRMGDREGNANAGAASAHAEHREAETKNASA
jgi:hypothetical protein